MFLCSIKYPMFVLLFYETCIHILCINDDGIKTIFKYLGNN